jgi:hypothetical protein
LFRFAALSTALGLALVACGSTHSGAGASGDDGGGGEGDAGVAVNDGGSAACPNDASAGACLAITWAVGPKLPTARNHHMTWLADTGSAPFIYVAGGSNSASQGIADVECAGINPDGTLRPWEKTTPLPNAIIGAGVTVTHGEVVLAGGYGLTASWRATINADGSMGTWTAGPALPGPWFHTAAVSFANYVYVIGGLNGMMEIDQVVRATVAADGSLGAFQAAATLPYPLSHHSAVVQDHVLYVLGGESSDGIARPDVLSAVLSDDGTIGAWKHEISMPMDLETQASFVYSGSIYAIGGISGLGSVNNVLRSPLSADGSLGAWLDDKASALPHARSHVHQMPIYQGWVYSVAGAPTGFPSVTTETDIGTFH